MKNSLFRGKSTRTKIFTAITLVAIVLLIVLNMLLAYASLEGQLFIDLTPETFYTLSEKMKSSCEEIMDQVEAGGDKEIKITFCADSDHLTKAASTRATYFMALQMRNMFDNIKVETVNVALDPAAVSMYRTTSHRQIVATDMIVSYDGRYKVVDATSFWTDNAFSYNGEYRMVSILASLTALNSPAAYFVIGHGETYYDPENPDSEMSISMATAAELIEERGLTVKTLDLSTVNEIPADCALLLINAPSEDFVADEDKLDSFYYISDLEKIDRYLHSKSGAVIVNKGYDKELPELESFLAEWGIGYGNSLVKDKDNSLSDGDEEGTTIVGVYDIDSFGGAYYGDYANLETSPKMVFTDSGYLYCTYAPADSIGESGSINGTINYSHFITTSDKAVAYEGPGSATITDAESKKALAAASVRTQLDGTTGEKVYSYLFCTATEDFLSNDLLANKSYANYGIMASLISSISRIDRYASMELGGLSMNSPSYGGKQTWSTTLTDSIVNVYSPDAKEIIAVNQAFRITEIVMFTIIACVAPVTALVFGIVVYIKRKNL